MVDHDNWIMNFTANELKRIKRWLENHAVKNEEKFIRRLCVIIYAVGKNVVWDNKKELERELRSLLKAFYGLSANAKSLLASGYVESLNLGRNYERRSQLRRTAQEVVESIPITVKQKLQSVENTTGRAPKYSLAELLVAMDTWHLYEECTGKRASSTPDGGYDSLLRLALELRDPNYSRSDQRELISSMKKSCMIG